MEQWLIKSVDSNLGLIGKTQTEKIINRIIANRGIETEKELKDFLRPSLSKMYSPELMKDMKKAGEIILESISNSERIRIVGDYDVDGIMSSYILYKFLKDENKNTDYQLPHRILDGYGLNEDIVNQAITDKVNLIITCDNGISCFDPIQLAKDNDIKVIVLDHHEPKIDEEGNQELPSADAVVDPKRTDCDYPFKGLCGGAIAYKFIDYISPSLGYDEGEIVRDYLEFAAIATVCDVMDLVDENRIIVKNGLKLLNNTTNLGLKTLMRVAGIENSIIAPYHLGFIIGPMFNASGRLDSATKGLELLLEKNVKKANSLALELQRLNKERTKLTIDGLEDALKEIAGEETYKDDIIITYLPHIHESIAGIIAGRIKEKFNKPSIVLSKSGNILKGSARSIEEYDITKGIARESELLESYGGHKLAAGLSLKEENLSEFRRRLNENSGLKPEDFIKKVYIDLGLPIHYVDQEFIKALDILGPFGNGNPTPTFGVKNIKLGNFQLLGKNKNVIRTSIRQGNTFREGILFFGVDEFIKKVEKAGYSFPQLLVSGEEITGDIVYKCKINEYKGMKNVQLEIQNYRIFGGDDNG